MKSLAAFVLASLAACTAFAVDCTPDQIAAFTTADEKMHSVCEAVFARTANKTGDSVSNGIKTCRDTKCMAEMETLTANMPDCTIANKTSKAEYMRQFASIRNSCKTLGASVDSSSNATDPVFPENVECTSRQVSLAYELEAKVKDACGSVFTLAATVSSDPDGGGKKICNNYKCLQAFDSMDTSPTTCTIQGLQFRNAYMRQYAKVQLECKKLGVTMGPSVVTKSCDDHTLGIERFLANDLLDSSCGWAVPVAWYPKNDTAASTKLCKDTLCLSALQSRWMAKPDCVSDSKNLKLYYANMTSAIMDECQGLGIKVEYASGLPPKGAASAAIGATTAVLVSVLAVVAAVVKV